MGRNLSEEEARRILKIAESAKRDVPVNAWPGNYNLGLLAQAVNERRRFVEFEPYKRFSIRYDNARQAVFIKPVNNGYVPCGYFSYDKLKGLIADE